MYHQQQNNWLPQKCLLDLFFNLHSNLAVVNLFAHNNIIKSYYVQVNSLRLNSSVASKWESKHLWGGTNYFAGDGTYSLGKVCQDLHVLIGGLFGIAIATFSCHNWVNVYKPFLCGNMQR